MKNGSKITTLLFLVLLFSSCANIGKNALKKATENIIPATQNVEDAAQNIEDATQNIEDSSQNIEDAVKELKNTIAQLEASSVNLVGAAGEEVREVIAEFAASANSVIQTVEDGTINIIKQSEKSAIRVVGALTQSGKTLLRETNHLVTNSIKCLDEATAKRIAQLTDSSLDIIDRFNVLVNQTIKTVADETQETIQVAGTEVSLLVSRTTYSVVNILLLIAAIVFFALPAILFMFKITKSANIFKKIIGPSLSGLLGAICLTLFFIPAIVWSTLGYAVVAQNFDYQQYCSETNIAYANFLAVYNTNPNNNTAYLAIGLEAIDLMNHCSYGNPNDNVIKDKQRLAENIEAILFPPPPPESNTIDYADCNNNTTPGSGKSIHPWFYSKRTKLKANILKEALKTNKIKKLPAKYNVQAVNPSLIKPATLQYLNTYESKVNTKLNIALMDAIKPNLKTLNLSVEKF